MFSRPSSLLLRSATPALKQSVRATPLLSPKPALRPLPSPTYKLRMPSNQAYTTKASGENPGEEPGELKTGEYKNRPPYRIHESGENFHTEWEGSCHCGKVQFQLSRKKPLAAKYCHCTTCQVLHGMSRFKQSFPPITLVVSC